VATRNTPPHQWTLEIKDYSKWQRTKNHQEDWAKLPPEYCEAKVVLRPARVLLVQFLPNDPIKRNKIISTF
jgi:hypothetical protein